MPHRDPDRLSQIERVTAELFGKSGYYATSLQSIADMVGITKAGLLHYVGSKDNLLTMVMRDYDVEGMAATGLTAEGFAADGPDAPATDAPAADDSPDAATDADTADADTTDADAGDGTDAGSAPRGGEPAGSRSVPEYFRQLVETNARRPEFVRLFTMLNTETLNPDHPAHAYFREREAMLEREAADPRWRIPEGVDGQAAIMAAFLAMDGIQITWLREPGRDLVAMWRRIEPALFPPQIWGEAE